MSSLQNPLEETLFNCNKKLLKNFDGYEFDSYEDRADDEIVDKIEDLIFGKNDKKSSDFLKALWKLRNDMYQGAF